MANQYWIDPDDDDEDEDGNAAPPKGDTLPESARKYLRRVEKELKEEKAKNAEFAKAQRKSSVEAVVKAKGYAPGVASVVPTDLADDAAITKWLDDNGSLFAKAEASAPQSASASNEGAIEEFDDEYVQSMQAMQNITSQTVPAANFSPANLMALIKGADSKEALEKILANPTARAIPVR